MLKQLIIHKIKSAAGYLTAFLKWGLIALVIGFAGGAAGIAFHTSVTMATNVRTNHDWLIFLLPVGGLVIVGMYRLCKMLDNKGTDAVISSIRTDGRVPLVMAPLIFISTVITHLLGGSAGREGAALQLGGSIGGNIGRLFRLDEKDMHMVVMCGMSAVFSALFGTPLTAAFFALGVTSVGIMYYSALVPCLISSLTAYLMTLLFRIEPTHFILNAVPDASVSAILQTIVIALLCAELSIIFCTVMHAAARQLRIWFKNPYIRAFAGGVIIVLLTLLLNTHDYNGSGMEVIERALLSGKADTWAWALKIVFTAITIGSGFKGGEIVPTFFIGATFGCVIGRFLGIDAGFAAAVGMVSMFCGVLNCPVASIFLSIELFGSSGMLLFAIATAVSYMLSGYYGLYSSQKIMYSKLKAEYINKPAK